MTKFQKTRIEDYIRHGLTQEQAEAWVLNHIRPENNLLQKCARNREIETETETAINLASYKVNPETELNIQVAEKVLGHKVIHTHFNRGKSHIYTIGEPDYYDNQGEMKLFNPLPRYSTDIEAAWEIVERLSFQGSGYQLESQWCGEFGQNGYTCRFANFNSKGWCDFGIADTAPHAICLAALKAIESNNV